MYWQYLEFCLRRLPMSQVQGRNTAVSDLQHLLADHQAENQRTSTQGLHQLDLTLWHSAAETRQPLQNDKHRLQRMQYPNLLHKQAADSHHIFSECDEILEPLLLLKKTCICDEYCLLNSLRTHRNDSPNNFCRSIGLRDSTALRTFSRALYNMTSSVLQKDPQRCCRTSLMVST